MPLSLQGVFVPTITPFDPVTGEVDLVGFRSNLRRWAETPIRGFVVGGSTGEAVLLDEDERRTLWENTREIAGSDRLLIAGSGAESTRATLRLSKIAADAGADAVLVQPPAFYRGAMTADVLRRHYTTLAEALSVPVIVYQVPPKLSTLDFPTGLVAELSNHPNIVGIKDSRGDLEKIGELVTQCREGFQVLVGSGALLYPALEIGAVGGILGVANLLPDLSADIESAFRAGRTAEAGRMQQIVGPVHNAIIAGLGVPGVKAGCELLGYASGAPRPPLAPLGDEGSKTVESALSGAGALA